LAKRLPLAASSDLQRSIRGKKIFGVLPRTRGWNCLAFKIENPSSALCCRLDKDPRIGGINLQKGRWFTFEISSDADLHEALDWLGHAYDAAGKSKKSK